MPPHDELAEQSVLGAMMLSRNAVLDTLGVVEAGDFYDPRHEHVFAAISALHEQDRPADVITVTDELQRTGKLAKAGDIAYLHELTSAVPSIASAGYYAGIVRDMRVWRRMVEAGTRITQWGFAREGEDVNAQIERARAELDGAVRSATRDVEMIGGGLKPLVDSMQAGTASRNVIPTPWEPLNRYVQGLKPGQLVVIGARPSEGKSIIALQLARAMAERGPVAFASMEMSREDLVQRLLASVADVHMGSITRGSLTQEEWQKVALRRGYIEGLKIAVDERSEMTVTQIRSFARSVSRRGPLGGVVVDYLQLVSGVRGQNRYETVTETSRQLKILAREMGCPVVALSQLNRGDKTPGGKPRAPRLSDLRESGQIEQDADVVILLERELEKDGLPGPNLHLHIAKQRQGKLGEVTLNFEGPYTRVSTFQPVSYELPFSD